MRILVVEDELLIAMDIESKIVVAGHECVGVVPSGRAALAALEDTPADVVIMDLQLADGPSGVSVAREVRETFGTAIVFLSANADDPTWRDKMVDVSGGHVLSKPCTADEIIRAVEAAGREVPRGASSQDDKRPVEDRASV